MKIAKKILENMIKEELSKLLKESKLEEREYIAPTAGWFDDKIPSPEFERLVNYIESHRISTEEKVNKLKEDVKKLSGQIQTLILKSKKA